MAVAEQYNAVGKRKSSIARVYFRPRAAEEGVIRVNGRAFDDYFPRKSARAVILKPLELTETVGQYDIFVNVCGGGLSGQAGAVRHGISRCLQEVDRDQYRPVLKKNGMMTRDAREVERKKYGLAGARRRFQYSKR